MRRKSYKKYLWLLLALLFLLGLPLGLVEKGRMSLIALFSHAWKPSEKSSSEQYLELENHLLRIELGKLRALLDEGEEVARLAEQTYVQPAQVIYRDPGMWMSAFWVNVGEETNQQIGKKIIVQNSPVVCGCGVVGVIDYVGKRQSRVRLITDMALKPSVRAARGLPQNAAFVQHIDAVLARVKEKTVCDCLNKIRESLDTDAETWFLAKGVICGAGAPLWRNRMYSLKGYGFNYDFPDAEGVARELSTGKPLEGEGRAIAIIKENDLLVTTGMDGVFPVGLKVAEVTRVYPLREGAYTYEIDAVPVIKNLDSLQTVFIIPKIGFDPDDEGR